MKKRFLLASALAVVFCATAVNAQPCPIAEVKEPPKCEKQFKKPPMSPEMKAQMEKKKAEFDKKLNLTDAQKEQAKQIHKKGFEQIKPVMEQIKIKKEAIKAIKDNGALTQADAKAQIAPLKKELFELHKKAGELRKQNMQEFESILTDKQKKTLEKMKKEGRKDFAKKHKKHHGFKGPKPPCQIDKK